MPSCSLRSTRGCWTCRVRRKKCDEIRPTCNVCQSLHITCHGYSRDRPEWMDNGKEEEEMVESLKKTVRLNTRRRKNLRAETQGPHSSSLTSFQLPSWPDNPIRERQDDPSNVPLVLNQSDPEIGPARQEREPGLIMHFFDHVFPLQYPGYRPLAEEGGRGWYLSLMLSDRTLYHAVLCLSAYHREMTIRQKNPNYHDIDLRDLEMHNTLSFKVLQGQLQHDAKSMGLKQRIGMLAGIVQMMFFQLLFFHDDKWSVHLEILITMINDIHADVLKLFEPRDRAVVTCDDIPAFLFFCGLLIWIDHQWSVSIGKAPRLSELHDQVLNEFPALFRLQNIIGCESWVVRIIGRIAGIQEWRNTQAMLGKNITIGLCKESEQIRDDLNQGLERTWKKLQNPSNLSERSSLETTRIFALAAMTYLHVTISGPRVDLAEIQTSVRRTLYALNQLKDNNLLKVLHWPLYLTGCMAIGEDRKYILDLFGIVHVLYSGACAQDRYSQRLKEYWAAREMDPNYNLWETGAGRPLFI